MIFRQCELVNGNRSHVAWIPDGFAERGRVLKIKDRAGVWSEGWMVQAVYPYQVRDRDLPDYRKGIRSHRNHTGDALMV